MKKSIFIIGGIIIIAFILFFILCIFLPIPILHEIAAAIVSTPCGYTAWAWGMEKMDCDCDGIIVDTSCNYCMDAPATRGCIGKATNFRCYIGNQTDMTWKEVPCEN
ncbi:hypothetical protein ACFLZN_00735 [Nanoarchaeota archaeon]